MKPFWQDCTLQRLRVDQKLDAVLVDNDGPLHKDARRPFGHSAGPELPCNF